MNAEIERLALQAEDAGKAGDTGAVAKAHEDIASIMAIMPHRYPFLLVDRITELEPGKRVVGLKNVSINEPFFQFWKVLATNDLDHPSAPQFFHRLEDACDWLGLDAAGTAEVVAVARAGCAR